MKNNQKKMPLNIQLFAEGGTAPVATTDTNVAPTNTNQSVSIDYDKIQGMIDSRNQKNEDSILKAYFQKEGLSEDDMKIAISNFKTQKAESDKQKVVDNENLQNQLKEANAQVLREKIEREALVQALELGVDIKTLPYLTKLADFSKVSDDKGVISGDKVKEALNKVLEDVPGLKKQEDSGTKGVQVGADTSNSAQPSGNLFGFNFTGVRKQ